MAWWSRLSSAFPLLERHAGLEQVFPSLSLAIDRVFSKLFRLSSILFSPNLVILDRLQRYPGLAGHLGAQISFSQDSENFFLS